MLSGRLPALALAGLVLALNPVAAQATILFYTVNGATTATGDPVDILGTTFTPSNPVTLTFIIGHEPPSTIGSSSTQVHLSDPDAHFSATLSDGTQSVTFDHSDLDSTAFFWLYNDDPTHGDALIGEFNATNWSIHFTLEDTDAGLVPDHDLHELKDYGPLPIGDLETAEITLIDHVAGTEFTQTASQASVVVAPEPGTAGLLLLGLGALALRRRRA